MQLYNIIQIHQITINLLFGCVKIVEFNFKSHIFHQETHFLNQDASFLNQEGRRQFLITKGFIKGEALRLLRTNSSEITFEENMRNFSTRLKNRDYPATTVEKHLSEFIFADRKKALEQRQGLSLRFQVAG